MSEKDSARKTSRQERAWNLYSALVVDYEAAETGDDPSAIRRDLARFAFRSVRDFEGIEAEELMMDRKPCPECGGTGEMEGLPGSALE